MIRNFAYVLMLCVAFYFFYRIEKVAVDFEIQNPLHCNMWNRC